MNISETLHFLQQNLHAPKGQWNKFGNFGYRSLEDILEAIKPRLAECNATIRLSDEIVEVGGRIYVKATATLLSIADGAMVSASAFAREAESKKGMDSAQLTGACSSYARKYALGGLLALDDTKDADTQDNRSNGNSKASTERSGTIQEPSPPMPPENYISALLSEAYEVGIETSRLDAFAQAVALKNGIPNVTGLDDAPWTVFEAVRRKVKEVEAMQQEQAGVRDEK
jgi:hypothetical protein